MKKFYFYDKGTTLFLVAGFLVFHFAAVYCCCRFFQNYAAADRWILIAFMMVLVVFLDLVLLLSGFIRDLLSRYSFDARGIHCFNLQWGRYVIPWDSVRTYGVFYMSVSYMKTTQAFFSQNPKEPAPQTMKERSTRRKDRIVVNLSLEIWAELEKCMPLDMKDKFNDALQHKRGGYFRR